MGATGPRTLRLAGELADGTVLTVYLLAAADAVDRWASAGADAV